MFIKLTVEASGSVVLEERVNVYAIKRYYSVSGHTFLVMDDGHIPVKETVEEIDLLISQSIPY